MAAPCCKLPDKGARTHASFVHLRLESAKIVRSSLGICPMCFYDRNFDPTTGRALSRLATGGHRSSMTELHQFGRRALQVSPEDNVAVALDDLPAGEAIVIGDHRLVLRSPVRSKHKFALNDLLPGT